MYLSLNFTASKRISCVRTKYKEDNIFIWCCIWWKFLYCVIICVTTLFIINGNASSCDVYTLYYVFKGETGNIITFTQFEEGGILTKTRNDEESIDKSNDNSIMPPLLSKEEIDAMDSGDESNQDHISMKMLEDIWDGNQSHPNVNQIGARYKICGSIRQRQSKWKGALNATQNMGKVLHKVFDIVVKNILQ